MISKATCSTIVQDDWHLPSTRHEPYRKQKKNIGGHSSFVFWPRPHRGSRTINARARREITPFLLVGFWNYFCRAANGRRRGLLHNLLVKWYEKKLMPRIVWGDRVLMVVSLLSPFRPLIAFHVYCIEFPSQGTYITTVTRCICTQHNIIYIYTKLLNLISSQLCFHTYTHL